jgi:hypothetical protein
VASCLPGATMRIEQALSECRTLTDVPALIASLGGEPRFAEFSPSSWLGAAASRYGVATAAEVGRFGALRCVALTADDASRATGRIARLGARRGEPVFLVALGTAPGCITVGVAIDPPVLLTVDPDAPDRAALAALRRLGECGAGGATSVALRMGERLGARRVDQHFFTAFRDARDRLAAEGPDGAPQDQRRSLALLQLTRVLFLYFIQQKGWLDGRPDFLAREVDRHLSRGRSLPRDLLRPLFFGMLNRADADRRALVRRFGRVPFLNGGLFEPHLLERRWRFDHSNENWRQVFDGLFEHFQFTLDERSDGAAVAPDMLGRVFEGLMAADERKATGTFYTPARLVDALVADGAASVLAERLGIDRPRASELIAGRSPAAALALAHCRVLDPAVGSGAFLLGALELFTRLEVARDPGVAHRRRILRDRLFGVDLSAEAVRLAELRLWLASIQEDPDGPHPSVEPLPNLDANLRQGDMLHDPRWLAQLRRAPRITAPTLGEARRRFARESGTGKRGAWRALRAAEQEAAAESLAEAGRELERRTDLILADARTPDLFGARRGLDRSLSAALRSVREDRRRIREALRRLGREGSLPWFDAQSCFGEIFVGRGGFDLVIGNPPWVRAEEIPKRDREILAGRYRWWRGTAGAGFGHRPDLSVAFLERSLELAAPGGTVAMLVPAKLATAGYATAIRSGLARDTTLDMVADLGDAAADSFAAVTYPLALVLRKRSPPDAHRVVLDQGAARTTPQQHWSGAPWILKAPEAAQVVTRLRAAHPLLAHKASIHLGVKCGRNEAYLGPPDTVEPELIRRAVRGRDLDRYVITRSVPLLYPHDRRGRALLTLPPGALRHLTRHRRALSARVDANGGPWWAIHRTGPASAPHRVAWSDLARELTAVVLPREILPLNSCYLAVVGDQVAAHALAAWLNARWVGAIARIGADPARGGYSRFNARTVGALPWPETARADPRLAELARERDHMEERDDAIDDIVAEHLGLSARDRRVLSALD